MNKKYIAIVLYVVINLIFSHHTKGEVNEAEVILFTRVVKDIKCEYYVKKSEIHEALNQEVTSRKAGKITDVNLLVENSIVAYCNINGLNRNELQISKVFLQPLTGDSMKEMIGYYYIIDLVSDRQDIVIMPIAVMSDGKVIQSRKL